MVNETDEYEIKGNEWKKLSDQAKEPCEEKYEVLKAQYDRDPAIFLTNGGTKEKGNAALRKETMQLKKSKKASKDKDIPKRPAGGVHGQLLAEKREEIKNSLTTDHKITDVIRKAGERCKSVPADETQKMDAMEISCTSSSTVNTTMMRSRSNDAIWRDISDRRPAEKMR